MENIGEDVNIAVRMSSDKKVVELRGEGGSAGGVNAKAVPTCREDASRRREFYEYCERIIAAQYAIWNENGKMR